MRPWPDDDELEVRRRGPGDVAARGSGDGHGQADPHAHDHDDRHAHDESVEHEIAHALGHHHARDIRPDTTDLPVIGIVGAGAVGTALGLALHRAGWPIGAVASRDPARRERFVSVVPGAHSFAEPTAVLDDVELILLTVPDDAIARVAGQLHLYSGQALVHTSGLLGAEVLAPAMAAGTQIGSFHPLVAFADTERAVAALHGATVAVEGDDQLVALLARMAEAVGASAVRLQPGSKPAYHAAAMLAAGGLVALLDAIAELGRVAGLDEAGALAVYAPLVAQTIGNAKALGVAAALTGPMTRGDVGTLKAHLAELERRAPTVVPLYVALAEREARLAEERGALTPDAARIVREALATARAHPA